MSHLTFEQRYTISVMLRSGYTQASIAKALDRSKSVISREISRNSDGRTRKYAADLAQRKCNVRHKTKHKRVILTPDMRTYIIDQIQEKLSPEQIVGLSKRKGIACVSHQWIYRMIWIDKKRQGKLCKNLRNRGKPYKKRGHTGKTPGQAPNKTSIIDRPAIVNERNRLGDLEVDTVIGKHRKMALVTINDRTTGMLKVSRIDQKTSGSVTDKIVELLMPWKHFLHTITADNGPEFSKHETIAEKLSIDFYFAEPYKSWQRGSNENLNRLVRQYFPKGTDFNKVDTEYITFVENQINRRPRKRFGFLSPLEMFNQKLHL